MAIYMYLPTLTTIITPNYIDDPNYVIITAIGAL